MKVAGAFVLVAGAVVAVAGQTTRTVWDGVYSDAQAARGKKSYITNCAACHQEGLQGADLAPALKGDEFLLRWADRSMFELVDRVQQTMPQDNPGGVSAQENGDIVAYMLQVNRFPAGKEDLPSEAAGLKTIAITKAR